MNVKRLYCYVFGHRLPYDKHGYVKGCGNHATCQRCGSSVLLDPSWPRTGRP